VVTGHFEGQNVNLAEDFVTTYDLDHAVADTLQVLTYRNPVSAQPSPTETSRVRITNEPGFFEVEALLGFGTTQLRGGSGSVTSTSPKTLVILFDTSLLMQWEKLERSYQALEGLLRTLRPSDRFNLLLFNNQIQPFQTSPVAADPLTSSAPWTLSAPANCAAEQTCSVCSRLALQQCAASGVSGAYVVLLSDGGATRGPIQNGKLATWYTENWRRLPEAQRPRTYVFGVGDDANLPLLTVLARQDGLLEHVLSTEPADSS